MTRSVRIILVVVVIQAILVGVYWLVDQERSPEGVSEAVLGRAPPQRLDGQLPPLSIRTRGGDQLDLKALRRPTLLHFWATWCLPCRAELPGLLAFAEEHGVDVVAVALDKDWADVDRFLEGRRPSDVFLGDAGEVESALHVSALPVTFLVDADGQLRLRFDGARDWTDSGFVNSWMGETGHGASAR